ncbi:hypothetical protein CO661_31375, partial [Sinorhizobium fredii]
EASQHAFESSPQKIELFMIEPTKTLALDVEVTSGRNANPSKLSREVKTTLFTRSAQRSCSGRAAA